jgi:hypothetical protein
MIKRYANSLGRTYVNGLVEAGFMVRSIEELGMKGTKTLHDEDRGRPRFLILKGVRPSI